MSIHRRSLIAELIVLAVFRRTAGDDLRARHAGVFFFRYLVWAMPSSASPDLAVRKSRQLMTAHSTLPGGHCGYCEAPLQGRMVMPAEP